MAHIHSVFDSNEHFVIDPVTRTIANSLAKKIVVMQYDHNSERFTFEIPKVDGHNMANCDRVEIHYINVDAVDKTLKSTGVYEVNDIQISPDDNSVAVFSWLLSRNCTKYAGTLSFLIHFACTVDGVEEYAWNTAIFQSITIGNGMNNGEEVLAEYPDILAQWKAQLFDSSETAVLNVTTAETNALAAIEEAGEAKKQAVLDSIPDEYEELSQDVSTNAARINELASTIKGSMSGEIVVADDVSPVEHTPKIWVHGKNLLNIPDTTVEGNYAWCNKVIGSFELAPGTYTISVDFFQQGTDFSKPAISARKYESVTVQYASTSSTEESGRLKLTFTIPDDEKGFTLYAYSNVTANTLETSCVFSNFQIEKSSVATEYTPYIDASTVELTRCGKAIFSKSSQIVSGENKPWASLLVAAVKVPPGDYVASCRFKQTGTDKTTVSMSVRTYNDYAVPFGDASSSEIEGNLLKQFTVTPGSGGFQIFLYSNQPNIALTTECSFENICVEAGTKATGYEVYKGAKFTPNEDGTVDGVTSLSPYMTILTDTEGVTVECEYNIDTKTYIDNKIKELVEGVTV